MRRIALMLLLAASTTAPASAADRTDKIPASVGPTDFRSYSVNPSANLPAGVTEQRWTDVAKRVMERWGATYLGTTTASPDNHDDGLNVVGFSTVLPGSVAGRNTKSKGGILRSLGGADTCAVLPNAVVTDTVVATSTPVKLRVRSDRVRRGKVKKRTLTVTRAIKGARIDSAPLNGQRCVQTTSELESDPASVKHESDIQMDQTPGAQWYPGPDSPAQSELDLETVLLHEFGHAAGLAHQPQDCDPSTPMRPSTGNGEYWRGVDEVLYGPPCSQPYPVTPDPATGAEGPYGIASLGGLAFHVNPAVPSGYDSARFVELAKSVIERWGGVYAGAATEKPTQGDGKSVIGFDVIASTDYEITNFTSAERLLFPTYADCALNPGLVTGYKVKKVTKKQRVRVRGRRRTLKLRRDRVITTKVPGIVTSTCNHPGARTEQKPTVREVDLGIAHEMQAYEMGPRHPVLLTRIDMASMLADAIGRVAGAPVGDVCGGQTPVVDEILPGEWWRSPTDVHRVDCPQRRAAAGSSGRSGRVRTVLVQD